MLEESMNEFSICQQHNLPENLIRPDSQKSEQKRVCRYCADIFCGIEPAQSAKDYNKALIERFESQSKLNLNQMNQIKKSLMLIRDAQIKKLDNLVQEIEKQISNQDKTLRECKGKILQQSAIKSLHEEYIKNLKIFQNNSIKEIEALKQSNNFDQNIKQLQEIDISILNDLNAQKKVKIVEVKQQNWMNIQENQNKIKRCEYQLLPKSAIRQEMWCNAIAFNRNATIAVAENWGKIEVYEFQNGKLKLIQKIDESEIVSLQFYKKCNQFISVNSRSIKIWHQLSNQQWVNNDELVAQNSLIQCSIINSNEDLIIAGGSEELGRAGVWEFCQFKIIFWKLVNNNKWKLNQEIECSNKVFCLSLNESNTKLISSQIYNKIEVFENNQNKWSLAQKIDVENYGLRLCFTSENDFVFLPKCSENLILFNFNNKNKLFEKVNQFQIKNGDDDTDQFPIQFIKSKNILLVKNSNYMNVFLKQEDQKFILIQQFHFETYKIVGSVSEDGEYILIYDRNSCQIQVRKLIIMQ